MKNKLYFFIIVAVLTAVPLFAKTLALDDEESRPAPVPASTVAVKLTATAGVTAIPTVYTAKVVQPKSTPTVVPAYVPAKPAATADTRQTQIDELKSKVDYIKKSLDSALAANNDISAGLREMQSDIKRIEERSLEIKGISQDMTDYKARIAVLEDKYLKDKEILDKAVSEMDKIKDSLKSSVDKLDGWSDIMEVLKKGISNNELEIAKMKKTINDLKLKYGDTEGNILTEISKWPYLGFVTLLLSIIAVSVAVAR